MKNFTEILNTPAKDVKAPPTLPAGQYIGVIAGPHKSVTSSKNTPGLQFTVNLQQAMGNVDEQMLSDAGGALGKQVNYTVYVTDNSVYYLKVFLEHLGIDSEGKTISEMLAEAPGKSIGVTLKNQPSKDGTRMTHFVEGTYKV